MSHQHQRKVHARLTRVVAQAVRRVGVRGRATAEDIEDMIGEVWLHLVEQRVLERVNPTKGTAEALVYVVAQNHTLSLLRKRRLLPWQIVPLDDESLRIELPSQGPDPAALRLAHRDLLRLLGAFSESDREILLLSLLHDLTAAEILAVRGEAANSATIGAMQKRLQRQKKILGELIEGVVSAPRPLRARPVAAPALENPKAVSTPLDRLRRTSARGSREPGESLLHRA